MTNRIQQMLANVLTGEHHSYRREVVYRDVQELAIQKMSIMRRVTWRLQEVLAVETPVILPEQKIVFLRTVTNLPEVFTKEEFEVIQSNHYIHEQGRICNISPDYERIIHNGLEVEKQKCLDGMLGATEEEGQFLECVVESIEAIYGLVDRYKAEASKLGYREVEKMLERIPRQGATTFYEALQFFRIIHYVLWCEGEYHNTIGRFDQYIYPYLERDLREGRLQEAEAFELLEEFFLTFNLDSDLYPGIQKGDNGQSMMLGGVDRQGQEVFNQLSGMCLEASKELKVIDPKINLRVNKNTPIDIYEQGTKLTQEGLGFPQYSNDDVVIEGLVKKGYALEDARDYTVAACWEFIIPKVGMDIPNIDAINFPRLINETIVEDLINCSDYACFYQCFIQRLKQECHRINERLRPIYVVPAPFMSLLMQGCIERKQDISKGGKYNNFGFHGVGISATVDSLYTIKTCVYEQQSLSKQMAIEIVTAGPTEDLVMPQLRYETAKFGDGDAKVNQIAVQLIEDFGKTVEPLKNERGGCVRAGTGSAMFYLWYADHVGNMLSGHRRGEAFSANYAPELFVRNKGPLSTIMSLSSPDFTNAINGGPMTMEFHSSVFRDSDGINKVARLVQQFICHGGHQIQLNSVNKEQMLAAQKNPEQYRNLIVRIWGWSAYFVELDEAYQNHVIARQEFQI